MSKSWICCHHRHAVAFLLLFESSHWEWLDSRFDPATAGIRYRGLILTAIGLALQSGRA